MSNEERTVIFQLPTVVSGSLACMEGTVTGRTWRLSAGTFVIGRSDECDLHLPAEPGVSKVHAKILAEGDHYVLEDNESRNGTIVNGHVVRRVMLADGDEIQICGCRLRVTQTGGEGRRGPVAPEATAAPGPAAAAPAPATAEPPTDLVPRVMNEEDVAAAAGQPSGGGLFMPFLLGMILVLAIGGGGAAALLLLVDESTEVATNAPEASAPSTTAPEGAAPAANAPATNAPATSAPEENAPAAAPPGEAEPPNPDQPATAEPPSPEDSPQSPEASAPEGTLPSGGAVDVIAGEAPKTAIRTRGGGRVRAVEAANGATLSRGQTILRLDDVALKREIATITESVNALAAIAETSEGAKAALADEKAKLRALQSQARQQRVSAPANGTLAGLTVRAGDRVRPRQVVGFVRGEPDSVVAKVPAEQADQWTKGKAVALQLRGGGSASATVSGAGKAEGAFVLIPLDVGSADTDAVTKARLK